MNLTRFAPVLVVALCCVASAHAQEARSILRLLCDDEAAGAVVTVNGQFKGECPVDITVAAGTLKVRVVKAVPPDKERVFETELRVAAGTALRREVVLGPPGMTAEGRRRAEEAARLEIQREEQLHEQARALQRAITAEEARSGLFCFTVLGTNRPGAAAALLTPLWETASRDREVATQLAFLEGFVTTMHGVDPSWFPWSEFQPHAHSMSEHLGNIVSQSTRLKSPMFGKDELQTVTQRCYPMLEQARHARAMSGASGAVATDHVPPGTRKVVEAPPPQRPGGGTLYCVASLFGYRAGVHTGVWTIKVAEIDQSGLQGWLDQFTAVARASDPKAWRSEGLFQANRRCGVVERGGRCNVMSYWGERKSLVGDVADIECHDTALNAFRARRELVDAAYTSRTTLTPSPWMPKGAEPAVFAAPAATTATRRDPP